MALHQDATCSTARAKHVTRHCACTDGLADTCEDMGTCAMPPCDRCKSCLTKVTPFTVSVQGASPDAVVAKWSSFCTAELEDEATCDHIKQLISQSLRANLGRRAGALCTWLQECPPAEALPNCSISYQAPGKEVAVTGGLSLCTVEGIAEGGTMLPGTFVSSPVPTSNSCRVDTDCRDPNLMCIMPPDATETCVCNAYGQDDCYRVGTCLQTPAKVCSDCFKSWTAFAAAHINEGNATYLSNTFTEACIKSRNAEVCGPVAAAISKAVNFGKRAAGICLMLPDCSAATLPPTASLLIEGLVPGSVFIGALQDLDYCTVEGFGGATSLPGVSLSSKWPPGACQYDETCTAVGSGLLCNKTSTMKFCTCDKGVDICVELGQCQPTPCTTCQTCLQAMASRFVASNLYQPTETLVSNFNVSCMGLQLAADAQTCQAVTGELSSALPNGNFGRRAGLLCKVMGQCDAAALEGCSLMVAFPGQKNVTGTLDLCTVQGVLEGFLPEGIAATEGG